MMSRHPRRFIFLVSCTVLGLAAAIVFFLRQEQTPHETTSIISPADGDIVPFHTRVRGGCTALHKNKDLWLIVQSEDSSHYHPQPGPVYKPPRRMQWYGTVYLGQPGNKNLDESFDIYLAVTGKQVSQIFFNYLTRANEEECWPGFQSLPEGLTVLDTITVIRGDQSGSHETAMIHQTK